jgi:hypothetical protein
MSADISAASQEQYLEQRKSIGLAANDQIPSKIVLFRTIERYRRRVAATGRRLEHAVAFFLTDVQS